MARYGVGLACAYWLGAREWALATLVVNVVGSFVLALLVTLVAQKSLSPDLQLIVGTGFAALSRPFRLWRLKPKF